MAMEGKASYPATRLRPITEPGLDEVSCSGLYVSKKVWQGSAEIELKLDVDRPRPYHKALHQISGTIMRNDTQSFWSGAASLAYFRSVKNAVQRVHIRSDAQRVYYADVHITLSDGSDMQGSCHVDLTLDSNQWCCNVELKMIGSSQSSVHFSALQRSSTFFREVTIDIDYVDDLLWPTIELQNYKGVPREMKQRKMDLFSVFEDAGLKLHYNAEESQKVSDPTPGTPWMKSDMYAVMDDYFQDMASSDANIWCLQATNPPDSRYMGYSFVHEGQQGFGLFLKHKSFLGYKSGCAKAKAKAARRLLHYLTHECGHCLGLSHPFEEGNPDSLSWMNYAWKYDSIHGVGSFYDNFQLQFSDDELSILRHQPERNFKSNFNRETGKKFDVVFDPRSDVADDEDEEEVEADEVEEEDNNRQLAGVKKRKVAFNIKVRPEPYSAGDVVEFEATLSNVGKLPCKIEPNLQLGAGTLTVLVTNPRGHVKQAKPFVHGIDSPARRYVVLGSNSSREYATSYSETVPLAECSSGPLFTIPGSYFISATYQGAGLQLNSNRVEILVEDDDDSESEDVKNEVRVAASLEGSGRSSDTLVAYWRKQMAKPIASKSKRIPVFLMLMDALSKRMLRVAPHSDRSPARKRRRERAFESVPPVLTRKRILADTEDLVTYLHANGGKTSAAAYGKLVSLRTHLFALEGNLKQAEAESNQLVADLINWGVDYDVIKGINDDLKQKRVVGSSSEAVSVQSDRFQKRVEDLINWSPKDEMDDEDDLSGLGLGRPFNDFDTQHKDTSHQFIEDLRRVEEETDDLDAVLDYAEALQRSREINEQLYRFVIEAFIVHSPLAKQNHVRYPDPEKRDGSMTSSAAMKGVERVGDPQEAWMNYWRCDGDFNYHHRHWHAVYRGYRWVGKRHRQGELFGYMHAQMLARYDAERESWGLQAVQPYDRYEVEPDGFNAGWELHEDRMFSNFQPRPKKQKWQTEHARQSESSEKAIRQRYKEEMDRDGTDDRPVMDANLAGFIIESTGWDFQRQYGNVHNMGHMSFTRTAGLNPLMTTYMGSSQTAVRDPIFFRWHKVVDDLYQAWNDLTVTELGSDNVGVIVDRPDVIITPDANAPAGFDKWDGSKWANSVFESGSIETYLREAELKFEWDNKIDHQPFSYHIRLRRKPDFSGDLSLTMRLFICQQRHVNNRRYWIEMDKFVYRMAAGESHGVIKRRDVESSVIKRLHEHANASEEVRSGAVRVKQGNCDCGWPYRMLLPRGTHAGEDWCLAVFVSNNDTDMINYSASCGSMSYCGTRDQDYPDQRTMGYPFATPIEINGKEASISQAEQTLDNFCIVPFQIKNDHEDATTKPPAPKPERELVEEIIWKPLQGKEGKYSSSRRTGRFRILIDQLSSHATQRPIRVQFKGRKVGSYQMKSVEIAQRRGNTLAIYADSKREIRVDGATSFEVPPEGALSDEITLPMAKPEPESDYFLSFTLLAPASFLYGRKPRAPTVNSYRCLPRHVTVVERNDDWGDVRDFIKNKSKAVYCVQHIVGLRPPAVGEEMETD